VRIPNEVHRSQDWRIHEVVPDFTLEDVWALPAVEGGPDDFPALVATVAAFDPARASSLPTRFLWGARDLLGRWAGLGGISAPVGLDDDTGTGLPIPGTTETSVADRLPEDLRGTAAGVRFDHLPFVPLYRTDEEFAAEISNATVHGLMHLAWVSRGDGRFSGQMAVYVQPRGRFGSAYLAFIKPFRHGIVYPALERGLARAWEDRPHG